MRTTLFIAFMLCLVPVDGFASVQTMSSQKYGKIKGTIFDQYGARIITANVSAENESHKFSAQVNDLGEFEQSLPVGAYEIIIQANGFCSFRRKAIVVNENEVVIINTTLAVRSAPPQCDNNEAFVLVDPAGKEDYVGINYAEKIFRDESVEYTRGYLSKSGDIQVSVNYHGINFTAEKVVLNPRTFDLEATGNVLILEGEKQKKLDHLSLRWKKKIVARHPVIRE